MIDAILSGQNPDGGWPYRRGVSWTEPTALCLLALASRGRTEDSFQRGIVWLRSARRPGEGWPPQPAVQVSTWVTALVLPVLLLAGDRQFAESAVYWLLRQTGEESTWVRRLRRWLSGERTEVDYSHHGWPWYPGSAAWVTPTALAILALERARQAGFQQAEIGHRIEQGRRYLLSRVCGDGGWNHGASRALGYESGSYPETTGLALVALRGSAAPGLERSLDAAEQQLGSCRSSEGQSWLQMGLLAHGRRPASRLSQPAPCRNLRDQALAVMASSALAGEFILLGKS